MPVGDFFNFNVDFVEGARLLGAGLATIGLTGAGIGIVQFLEDFYLL